ACGAFAQLAGLVVMPAGFGQLNRALPPGSWLVASFEGDPMPLALLSGLAAGLTIAGIALAGDCYPELWETSARAFAIRRAVLARGVAGRREARATGAPKTVRSSPAAHVPSGEWTVLWKEWLTIKRGRGGMQLQVALMGIAV